MRNSLGMIFMATTLCAGLLSCDDAPRTSVVAPNSGSNRLLELDPPSPYRQMPSRPVVPVSNPAPATGASLNPAHGQPGHRCDIAVGAPLPSSTPPVAAASAPVPATTRRLNPKHGEPGHRCDISVGAPLPEAGAQPSAAPSAAPVAAQAAVVPGQTVAAPGNGSVKLNPKHGEPGHRCDIAVGSPLK